MYMQRKNSKYVFMFFCFFYKWGGGGITVSTWVERLISI